MIQKPVPYTLPLPQTAATQYLNQAGAIKVSKMKQDIRGASNKGPSSARSTPSLPQDAAPPSGVQSQNLPHTPPLKSLQM